jgi:hypothetical protein
MAPEPCLAVPCPLCRASAGEPCHEITWERAERRPHNHRRWAYMRERPQVGLFEEARDGE